MKKILLIALLAFFPIQALSANSTIIATVNNEIITDVDLNRRTQLLVKMNNIPAKAINQIAPQVLQMLVDEKLFQEVASKNKLSVTEAETDDFLYRICAQDKVKPEKCKTHLSRLFPDKDEFAKQIKGQLMWHKIIKTLLVKKAKITDHEVSLLSRKNGYNYTYSEIVLFSDAEHLNAAIENANSIKSKILSGSNFGTVARNFSQSSSSKDDGLVKNVNFADLDPKIEAALRNLEKNGVSDVITINNAVYIVKLISKQKSFSKEDLAKLPHIKEYLEQKKLNAVMQDYLVSLRRNAYIEIR